MGLVLPGLRPRRHLQVDSGAPESVPYHSQGSSNGSYRFTLQE